MRRVVTSPIAEEEIDGAVLYLAFENLAAAYRLRDRIHEAIRKVAAMPGIARPGRVSGTYEKLVPRTPYIIAFELPDADTLHVLRVIHAARDWRQDDWPE